MQEIIAYEMQFCEGQVDIFNIEMICFKEEMYEEYKKIYNECFFEMRRSLNVKPYNFYSSIEQLEEKKDNIYILCSEGKIVASVACLGNEIDDLIVAKEYQGKGYGNKLLLWAINYIREKNNGPIYLHVAKWNEKALKLYENNKFVVTKTEKVR